MNRSKEEKIVQLSEKLKELLMPIDLFIHFLSDEDAELIAECVDALADKLSFNRSALPAIMALGGQYDSTEDEMKLETIRTLKKLIDIRMGFKKERESKAAMAAQNKQVLAAMGITY